MGAGGEQVGRLVADRLGFTYIDEEIVSRTAAKAGIDAARALTDLVPEEAQPQVRQAVSELQLLYTKHAGEDLR